MKKQLFIYIIIATLFLGACNLPLDAAAAKPERGISARTDLSTPLAGVQPTQSDSQESPEDESSSEDQSFDTEQATETATELPTDTPTNTQTPTETVTLKPGETRAPTNTPTKTPVPTKTSVPTKTPAGSSKTEPTKTSAPSNKSEPTKTSTLTKTPVPTNTDKPNPGNNPTKTFTPTNIPLNTNTPTDVPPTLTNTPIPLPTNTSAPVGCSPSGNGGFESQVVSLVNQERAKLGLSALTVDSRLTNAARGHSQDMACNNFFSHTSPTTGSPFDRISAAGYGYSWAGENIAAGYGSPSSVMEGWMKSPGHKANILNGNYTQIGVGYLYWASSDYGVYWTQVFGSP